MKHVWFERWLTTHFSLGHGGDEYGNCTLYLFTPLGGVVWRYPTGHRQTEILMPEDWNDDREWARWARNYLLGEGWDE